MRGNMKDLFIDNNIAKNFSTPLDDEYKKLIKWLVDYDENITLKSAKQKKDFAHLVVNQKLLTEYLRSSYNCPHSSSIPTLIALLTRQGRLIKLENQQINNLKQKHLTKKVLRKLL